MPFCNCLSQVTHYIQDKFLSLGLFFLRFSLAIPFWKSGLTKWDYIANDNIDTLYFLFEDYNVPFLPVKWAAWSGTLLEITLPVLLVFGFLTRLAGLGVILLSVVIYTVDQNPDTYLWASMAFMLCLLGGGNSSIDRLIKLFCR